MIIVKLAAKEVNRVLPNLKLLRKKAGVSQQTLAEAIGVSQQSVNQYENHNIEPDITALSRIADYFHVSIDFIVGREAGKALDTLMYVKNDEAALIDRFRALTPAEQRCVQTVIDTLLDKNEIS